MHSSLALPVGSLELIHGLALVDDDMIAVDPGDALDQEILGSCWSLSSPQALAVNARTMNGRLGEVEDR